MPVKHIEHSSFQVMQHQILLLHVFGVLCDVALQVVKVAGVSLWALFREKKEKPRN